MDREVLKRLQKLNQIKLTENETEDVLDFFAAKEEEMGVINAINTDEVVRMVHVMPLENVLREDVIIRNFSRDELQKGAPETYDGYWQVPRLVE